MKRALMKRTLFCIFLPIPSLPAISVKIIGHPLKKHYGLRVMSGL